MIGADYLARIQAVPYGGPEDRTWTEAVFAVYCEMLRNRVHFAQAAYRDAEFPWLMDRPELIGHPNGEVWEARLGAELRETLLDHVGQWCVYFAAHNPVRPLADAWLAEHKPTVEWIPDRPFGRASEQGLLRPFWDAVAGRRVCLIGNQRLAPIATRHGWTMLGVMPHSAWMQADRTAELVLPLATAGIDLFLIAAGSAAALIIHRAWPHVKGRATLIDIGSTLDPYCGVFSRNRTRKPEWQRDVLPLNMP